MYLCLSVGGREGGVGEGGGGLRIWKRITELLNIILLLYEV